MSACLVRLPVVSRLLHDLFSRSSCFSLRFASFVDAPLAGKARVDELGCASLLSASCFSHCSLLPGGGWEGDYRRTACALVSSHLVALCFQVVERYVSESACALVSSPLVGALGRSMNWPGASY